MTAAFICFLALAQASPDHTEDRIALTRGVSELVAGQALPGVLSVSGSAFVVATGKEDSGRAPIFAAQHVESGRVVAASHEGFFSGSALDNPSNQRFLGRILGWLGAKSVPGLRVGLLGYPSLAEPLRRAGAVPSSVDAQSLPAMIGDLDVVCATPGALDKNPSLQIQIMSFVKHGHGLLLAGPAWGWLQLHPGASLLADHPGNRMLFPYGICFGDGTSGEPYTVETSDNPLFNTDGALASLKKGGLSVQDRVTAEFTLRRALTFLPADGPGLPAEIIKGALTEPGGGVPTPQSPITIDKPFSRLKAWLEERQMATLLPREVKANAAAAFFPGPVSVAAKRIDRTLTIDCSAPDWHGTGLYAVPGEVMLVSIPDSALAAGLSVRIGPHTDTLWDLDSWPRFPDISVSRPLHLSETQVASAFGGSVYIEVPDGCKLGKIAVTISHAVAGARYVRGQTSLAQWKSDVALADGPWAELEGKLVILSVPLSSAKKIADPAALMAFWDDMMKDCYGFFAAPVRPRPERYCTDIEISAGYMHSGYPIMTHIDVADTFCDLAKLRGKGNTWGFYHEMGHNFQQDAWTWEGTGEVTNNLFSLYGSEKLNGVSPTQYGEAHPAMAPEAIKTRLLKYLANGARYRDWTSDPFLALSMYAQLRIQFGWEPFTRLFEEYRGLRPEELPKTDLAKRDRWMVRFSRMVGRNLGPFFVAWGVPTSDDARKSIADLPTWMPADWPAHE